MAERAVREFFPTVQCRAQPEVMAADGFFSVVIPVDLDPAEGEGRAPARVMVKLPRPGPNGLAARMQGAMDREQIAYQDILPHTAIRAPRVYGIAVIDGDPIFVLEDLSASRLGDQLGGLTAADAVSAAVALSRVHAVRVGTLASPPSLRLAGRIRHNTVAGFDPAGLRLGLDVLRRRWTNHIDGPTVAAFERLVSNHAAVADALWHCAPIVFTHGDARADNMAFIDPPTSMQSAASATIERSDTATGSDSTTVPGETILFDWQQIAMQPAACDLAWMLATSVAAEDRANVQTAAIASYNRYAEQTIDNRALTLAFALPALAVLFLVQREQSTAPMRAIAARSVERIGAVIAAEHPVEAI